MEKQTTTVTTEPVAEENVATMLPVVGLNGKPVVGNGVDNKYADEIESEVNKTGDDEDLIKENFEDKIANKKTDIDVSYKIRKLIASIYTLKVKIEKAEMENKGKKDTKELIQMKRDYLRKKGELLSLKKSSSSGLKKAITELEAEGKAGAEEEIATLKEKKDKEEEVTEGVSMSDVTDYYITEMNHIKGIAADTIALKRLRFSKGDTRVKESEVTANVENGSETIKSYSEMIGRAQKLLQEGYNKHANDVVASTGKKFSDYVKITAGTTDTTKPILHKFGNKYVFMQGSPSCITFDAEYGKEEGNLIPFTAILHVMRKITQEAQGKNKDKLVTISCDTYNYKKEKVKGVIVSAYLRATIGKVKADNTKDDQPIKESVDDVFTEVYDAHKGKKAYFSKTEKKYKELEKCLDKLKSSGTDPEKRIEIAEDASDVISELIVEAAKIPDDGFIDSIIDINFFINGLKKVFAAIRASFTITGIVTYRPRTKRGEVMSGLRKMQAEVDRAIVKANKEIKRKAKEEEKEVKESVDDVFTEGDSDTGVSPELKRLDEKRGRLADLHRDLEEAEKKEKETGEKLYENKVKGLKEKIKKLQKEVDNGEAELAKAEKKANKEATKDVKESVMTEAANMEDEIRPIVEEFNRKGYHVKYASPGHRKLRKKEDREPDGIYHGKLYSDARIMFSDKYSFPEAPEYWHWRDVDGCSYLDITPKGFTPEKNKTPDEAFASWKESYMGTLKSYVHSLKSNGSAKKEEGEETTENVDTFSESVIDTIYSAMGLNDDEDVQESVLSIDLDNTLLKELDDLIS